MQITTTGVPWAVYVRSLTVNEVEVTGDSWCVACGGSCNSNSGVGPSRAGTPVRPMRAIGRAGPGLSGCLAAGAGGSFIVGSHRSGGAAGAAGMDPRTSRSQGTFLRGCAPWSDLHEYPFDPSMDGIEDDPDSGRPGCAPWISRTGLFRSILSGTCRRMPKTRNRWARVHRGGVGRPPGRLTVSASQVTLYVCPMSRSSPRRL